MDIEVMQEKKPFDVTNHSGKHVNYLPSFDYAEVRSILIKHVTRQ